MLEILHEENPSVPNPPIVVYLLEILHEENPPVPNPQIAIHFLEILREENPPIPNPANHRQFIHQIPQIPPRFTPDSINYLQIEIFWLKNHPKRRIIHFSTSTV